MRHILTATDITKYFVTDGKKFAAVNHESFFLDKSEFCSLVGESGSGKTTLVKIISGLISPDSGTVMCDGEILTPRLRRKNKALCAKLQLVLQNSRAALDPCFSVYETIAEPIKNLKKCSGEEERKTVEKLMEQMELPQNILSRRSGELSGGQQKRICIARAILKKPKILILDDSTRAVDTATEVEIQKRLREELPHMTRIIIAQRISSVKQADLILVLDDGKLEAAGTHEELMKSCEIYREIAESQRKGAL